VSAVTGDGRPADASLTRRADHRSSLWRLLADSGMPAQISVLANLPVSVAVTAAALSAEDAQAVVLLEVLVALEVQCRERYLVGEAAGRNPHVINEMWSAAQAGLCRQPSPGGGDCLVAGRTGMPDSRPASSSRRRGPRWRISAHLVSSPRVTKVISGSRPIRRVPAAR
jgi:hypothetical protein